MSRNESRTWTVISLIVALIGVFISVLAWRSPVTPASSAEKSTALSEKPVDQSQNIAEVSMPLSNNTLNAQTVKMAPKVQANGPHAVAVETINGSVNFVDNSK